MISCSWPNFSCLLNEIESNRARKARTAHIITKQLINFAVFAVKFVYYLFIDLSTLRLAVSRN